MLKARERVIFASIWVGEMIEKAVIDLSHWNTVPKDLKDVKTEGVVGVIHKASEGVAVTDSKYEARRYLAADAGLLWGAYHFIRPGSNTDQIANFLNVCGALLDGSMLVALDYEDPDVSLDQVVDWMVEVERQVDRAPVLYSGHVLKDKLKGKPDSRLTKYRLWLAQYSSTAALPPGWDKWWIWQYTDKGTCAGIDPPVDLNRFAGTKDQLTAEWSGSVPTEHMDIYCPPGGLVVDIKAIENVRCRFGCKSPVIGIFSMPNGCVCWPDPIQALCSQHANKAQSVGPIIPLLWHEWEAD